MRDCALPFDMIRYIKMQEVWEMEVLIILGSIAAIVLWVFVALEFRNIAAMKGHNEAKYFWWTFFIGPVGMLMVVALPQRIEVPAAPTPAAAAPDSDELPDI